MGALDRMCASWVQPGVHKLWIQLECRRSRSGRARSRPPNDARAVAPPLHARPRVGAEYMEVRLLAGAGAAFALLPVPDLSGHHDSGDIHLMDVEFLSPDRLVRYLARSVHRTFLEQLADSWLRCALEAHPEQSVATVEDSTAGVAFVVVASTSFSVTVEVLINADPEADVQEQDGISFDIARTTLIDAAHTLQESLG